MSRDDAFLQAILAAPEDDTPRLVYADWLDENGRPERAEFIRAQIELARLPEDDPRREGLQERERALHRAHEDAWLGEVGKLLSVPVFRRGFVERGAIGARQFLTNAERLFRLAPVRHLKLLRLPQMTDGPKQVAASAHLANLRGLDLGNSMLGDRKLEELLSSPHLGGLTSLSLRGTDAGVSVLRVLRASYLEHLHVLDLAGNPLGTNLDTLTEGEPPFRVEELDLGDCLLDSVDVSRLAAWPGLANVTSLRLRNNALRVVSGEYLASSANVRGLTHLDLCNTGLGVRGMRSLAASPELAGLRRLEVSGNAIGVSGLRALIESTTLTSLTSLHLGNNNLGDAGLEMLAGWPGLARLRFLSLANNDIMDRGVKALAASPYLEDLADLNLNANLSVGDVAARALAECAGLKRLRKLHLTENYALTDSGIKALLESPNLTGLRELALPDVRLSAETRQLLLSRFPPSR
jgi:uncharacterized protein (TIGR02996 family)